MGSELIQQASFVRDPGCAVSVHPEMSIHRGLCPSQLVMDSVLVNPLWTLSWSIHGGLCPSQSVMDSVLVNQSWTPS
jgi:hypothetical protein